MMADRSAQPVVPEPSGEDPAPRRAQVCRLFLEKDSKQEMVVDDDVHDGSYARSGSAAAASAASAG